MLHGPYGEDGTVQGLLEMANVPYVGSGVLASAVAMDKAVARQLFAQHGLPQVRYVMVMRRRWRTATTMRSSHEVEAELTYPLFVKPANMGSSVGVSKARSREQLVAALDVAAHFDRKLLVEEAVPHAREIEVSVLGNEAPIASVAGEIVPGNEFYDYNAKYENEGSRLLIPAPIDDATMADGARLCRACVPGARLCRSGACRLSGGRRERRDLSERDQHDAGFHAHQHVSEVVGSDGHSLPGAGGQAAHAGGRGACRPPGEQHSTYLTVDGGESLHNHLPGDGEVNGDCVG